MNVPYDIKNKKEKGSKRSGLDPLKLHYINSFRSHAFNHIVDSVEIRTEIQKTESRLAIILCEYSII